MLSDDQIEFFDTFGYLVIRDYLPAAEMTVIRQEFETAMDTAYTHQPFDGSRRQWLTMMGSNYTPQLAGLLEDDRFVGVAEQLYGKVVPFMVDGNRYIGDTQWHPDSTAAGGVKLFLYLEPLTAATGAIRVIPGSHKGSFAQDVARFMADNGYQAGGANVTRIGDLPCVAVETTPGDLVLFSFDMWHATQGGASGRPMCTLAYYREPADDTELDLIRRHAAGCFPALTDGFGIRDITPFLTDWFINAPGSPRRAELINRMEQAGVTENWPV